MLKVMFSPEFHAQLTKDTCSSKKNYAQLIHYNYICFRLHQLLIACRVGFSISFLLVSIRVLFFMIWRVSYTPRLLKPNYCNATYGLSWCATLLLISTDRMAEDVRRSSSICSESFSADELSESSLQRLVTMHMIAVQFTISLVYM